MAASTDTYPALKGLRVADAMHTGLISCRPGAPLRAAARMLATYRVHAILVHGHRPGERRDAGDWGVLTDADVLRACETRDLDAQTAGTAAARPPLTVSPTDALAGAARTMVDRGLSHVVVVEGDPPRPVGVLSTLDVARALAGFPERHPVRT